MLTSPSFCSFFTGFIVAQVAMSPITVRAEADDNSEISEPCEVSNGVKSELSFEDSSVKPNFNNNGNHVRLGSAKSESVEHDSASLNHRGVNHRPPSDDDHHGRRKNNNSRNSNVSRTSEESVRSSGGRRSAEGGRKSTENGGNRKSTDSQRSTTSEKTTLAEDTSSSDQLAQITDILLARLITTLSDSTLGNPAMLLQTLLGFSPDDYNDLLAALSESHLSYVDIISAYLHNIKVMSEDSGSTSAALSGTLTRSLIDQYNSLLTQAVKSPQSIARANLIGDPDGRSHLADLLLKASSGNESHSERRSLETLLPKGPSGLGFGRRHTSDASRQRQNFIQGQNMTETLSKSGNQSENGLLDLAKLFNVSKMQNQDLNSAPPPPAVGARNGNTNTTGNTGGPPPPATTGTTVGNLGSLSPEQLAAFLQNSGMLANGTTTTGTQFGIRTMPPNGNNLGFQLNPTAPPQLPMNGGMFGAPPLNYPYGMPSTLQQSWTGASTMPIQQQSPVNNRNLWQNPYTGAGGAYPGFRGWGGTGLETVPENFNSSALQMYPDQQSCFPAVINLPQQLQSQQQQSSQQ